MGFNTCAFCGAKNGRAGDLIISANTDKGACKNCYDTMLTGDVCIHSYLIRSKEEIQRTIDLAICKKETK